MSSQGPSRLPWHQLWPSSNHKTKPTKPVDPPLPRCKSQSGPGEEDKQATPTKLTAQQKFVMDTVKMAVALPQPDPQDRLRVLSSAAFVVSPIDKRMAKRSAGAKVSALNLS